MVQLREEQAKEKMVMPGFSINHEGEVVQGVVEHRHQTRQRHLSSGQDEDIASSYFAAQYGQQQKVQQPQQGQQQQRRGGSKQGSQGGSRRGSVNMSLSSNNGVQSAIANAAAVLAAKKQKEQEARQDEAKRLLQRREMTPDNLRHVEEKLIQLQRQRQEEEALESDRREQIQELNLPLESNLPPPPPRLETHQDRTSGGWSQEVRSGGEMTFLEHLPKDGSTPYRTESYGIVRVRVFTVSMPS